MKCIWEIPDRSSSRTVPKRAEMPFTKLNGKSEMIGLFLNNFYFAYTKGACFGVLQVKKDFSLDRTGTDA